MSWRDGVHITGTPIWCDARRRRDICFLSSADRVGRTGHGQLIGTSITLALLAARDKGHLAVPLRQRFTLGTVRLELIPSGRGFGAAALYADITGKTVLYAGAVRTSAGGVGDAAELRSCDAVVVAAPYGAPHHRFPPLGAAIDATIEWTRSQLALDHRPVLFVDSLLDGLEVASRLAAEGIAIAGGRALRDAGQRIADLVPSPQRIDGAIAIGSTAALRSIAREPRTISRETRANDAESSEAARLGRSANDGDPVPRPVVAREPSSGIPAIAAIGAGGSVREPRAIVWLGADRAGLARTLGDRAAVTALVSARASAGFDGYDTGFAWASAADHLQLLGWIEATGARDVFVTGACAEAIVAAVGSRARIIGPPHQMSLFPHEAFP